ncbi:FAD-dependent oxidoreductase [Immundisolibacter sp.]|uniref:FAD-dependent oxidoreductase n=1 Tax=Immundisolibacter sp. TaxID=1934948 RepID=UPI003569DE97
MTQQQRAATRLGQHAVVIGASIGGLLTARVLSDYYAQVTILDADTPPEQAVPRKAVPQGSHIHLLLAGGSAVVRKYFPGIHEDLLGAGARYVDFLADNANYMSGRWWPRKPSGINSYVMSRPLLETVVRHHTLALPNVQLRAATRVSGFLTDTTGKTITGVSLDKDGETIAADLVADVSGRASKTPKWLEQMGYGAPQSTTIGINVGYVTFEAQEPAGRNPDWNFMYAIQKSIPEDTRGGGLFRVEGGRYLVTATGYHKDDPPTDWAGFLEFLKSHPHPVLYEEVKNLQPTSDVAAYRYSAYLRQHYERLRRFPRGLVVLGDAMCSFNPVYGQGMTVAAKEAEYLDECLGRCASSGAMPDDFALTFFKGAVKFVDAAWNGVTVEDFRYPQTDGQRPRGFALSKWLNAKFFALSGYDAEFAVAFAKVLNLVDPPASILKFKYLRKALFAKTPVFRGDPAALPARAVPEASPP